VPGNSEATETVVDLSDGPAVQIYRVSLFVPSGDTDAVEASVFAGEDRIAPSNNPVAVGTAEVGLETDHRLSPSATLEVRASNTSTTAQKVTVIAHGDRLYDEE